MLRRVSRRFGPALLLSVLAGVLLLADLGDGDLWQDEAQTALVARTVLTHGIPLGTDGRNFFSQELGGEYGRDHVWRWHTWLPFYVLAGFLALFGESTWVARLPFALFGVATVVAAHGLARDLWKDRRAGWIAAGLVLTSVPFLLLSRQCRYYSLAAFFAVLGLHAYVRVVRGEGGRWSMVVFVLASVLLFHTHYVYSIALLAAVLAHAWLLHREAWKRVALACGISLAVNAPWIVWLSGMSYGERYETVLGPDAAARMAGSFLGQLGQHVVPPLFLALPVALAILRTRGRKQGRKETGSEWAPAILPLLFVLANLAILSFSAPAPFFRYLAPVLPVLAIVMAGFIARGWERRSWIGIAALAGLLLFQIRPLGDYLHEITHDFEGPVEGIVGHLNRHGSPGDVVAITYEDLPIKFYTSMRVLGGLTGEDLSPARDARWVIVRKYPISDKDYQVREYLIEHVPWPKYRPVPLEVPDTRFQNRESPDEHLFRTVQNEDRVVVFERVQP